MAALASCPNGTADAPVTIRFPPNVTYNLTDTITARDRVHVIIDGNGSTFWSSYPNERTAHPVWRLFKARNVMMKNLTARGAFVPNGPRSLETVNNHFGACEFSPGVALYGGRSVTLMDIKAENNCGDGFGAYNSGYYDHTQPAEATADIHWIRLEAKTTARMCFAPTQVDGFWLEDSSCHDAWYSGLDAETDARTDPARNIHILRNTFSGYNHSGIDVPVAGEGGTTADIEIRGNRLLTGPDKVCNHSIQVGAYPANPSMFTNIVTEDNEITALAGAIIYDHVDGGSVRNNRIRRLPTPGPPGTTVIGWCGYDEQIRVTNSRDVVVADNDVL
jgi:hypothetical protein